MEVDPNFAPPDVTREVVLPPLPRDSTGEVTLQLAPPEPDHPTPKARGVMFVGVALIAVAGLFFVGRWTTGGERSKLADERDSAAAERDHLQSSLAELENDLADATATNTEEQSMIDELESAAAHDATELADLQAAVATLTDQTEALHDSNDALWGHVEAVAECGNSVDLADAAFDKWDAMVVVLDEYLRSEAGSPEESDAQDRLDRAWADIDAAESDYVASSSRCSQAIELLPACPAPAAAITNSGNDTQCPTD